LIKELPIIVHPIGVA